VVITQKSRACQEVKTGLALSGFKILVSVLYLSKLAPAYRKLGSM
jgi:hypothetical protein